MPEPGGPKVPVASSSSSTVNRRCSTICPPPPRSSAESGSGLDYFDFPYGDVLGRLAGVVVEGGDAGQHVEALGGPAEHPVAAGVGAQLFGVAQVPAAFVRQEEELRRCAVGGRGAGHR